MAEINIGNLYDMNKQLMVNETPLDPILLNVQLKEVTEEISKNCYWMLLNNELHDYTVFHFKHEYGILDIDNFVIKDFAPTLNNRGQVLSIEKQEDGAYEIWIRKDNECYVYYLFNYEFGVIEAGE